MAGEPPQGWVLVPADPTPEMLNAGAPYTGWVGKLAQQSAADLWSAMLEKAPKRP